MATTVLATALPYSLDEHAPFHLTVFLTHKLVADAPPPDDPDRMPVVGDFPSVADWVTTLSGCTLTLQTSLGGADLPLKVVSSPSAPAWASAFPPSLAVDGFPAPSLSGQEWRSNPAHRMSDHAVDLHLVSAAAAPTRRPDVAGDPVAGGMLRRLSALDQDSALTRLLAGADDRNQRVQRVVAARVADALTTLGPLSDWDGGRDPDHQGPPLPDYLKEAPVEPSAIEVLLDDPEADTRLTRRLDGLVGADLSGDPQLQLLVDAHATRRYYERPDEPKYPERKEPDPDAPPLPRPTVPDQEFHRRAGSFGSTPALLRALGLALDVVLDVPDPVGALSGATWVSVTVTPPDGSDLTVLPPRRTAVIARGPVLTYQSSSDWVGGALPLGDDDWRVLDLDPDASGLKLDQHLRNLPRRYATEANRDPETSTPATLRTNGFAIARRNRMDSTRARVAAAEGLEAAARDLLFDDVVRGIRLEVWDDASEAWHSLHERRVTVTGEGDVPILNDAPDVGFLQLSALNRNPDATAYYLHEVVAGWDGWSLSAPRPGKTVVHVEPPGPDGRTEAVVNTPTDEPASGIHTRTRVEPGSLPRLRYGTSYSFRMLGVDLAGNSVPQRTRPILRPPLPQPVLDAARDHLTGLRARYAERDRTGLVSAVREDVLTHLTAPTAYANAPALQADADPAVGERRPSQPPPVLPVELRTGDAALDAAAADLLTAAAARSAANDPFASTDDPPSPDPLGRVNEASRILLAAHDTWRTHPQLGVDPERFAQVASVDDLDLPDDLGPAELLRRPVVTTPRPYLRWDPVPHPTLVARRELGTGEQLSRLVVRSGLTGGGADPDDQPTTERHVVPPKATQVEAETAGKFDAAMGLGADTGEVSRLYPVALAERGTLLDRKAPSLTDPTDAGAVDQPGIALLSRPGADPSEAVTLADIEGDRGKALGEGQYVAHDVAALRLPYLPDPYASGISLVFYDAGNPHTLPEPRVLQTVAIPYAGTWPELQPLRLVLDRSVDPAATLGAVVTGNVVTVTVPRGEQVRATLASTVTVADLDRFGMWRSQLASVLADPEGDGLDQDQVVASAVIMRAAAQGWTWWLTPSTDVRLVHAVPAPVSPPRLRGLHVIARPKGRGGAALGAVVDVHGPSTDRLVVRASWDEQVDDVTADGPVTVHKDDVVVNSAVAETERAGALYLVDFLPFGAGLTSSVDLSEGSIGLHAAIEKFPDTHYRRVTYVPSGTTRYREFFDAADVPADDDPSLAGEPVTLDILSSSRPAAPTVLDTVPLLRWEDEVEPAQPFARRRVRRSGVRIWLDRPWYSSGDGELLAVLVFDPFEPDPDHPGQQRLKAVQAPDAATSLWGADPILLGGQVGGFVAATHPPLLRLHDLLLDALAQGVAPRDPVPARPVAAAEAVPLLDVQGTPSARVFGYVPEYDAAARRWFVDVALEDGPSLWPFIRLAVARWQPRSLPTCELSPTALTSWVQPLPTRWLTVSRRDGREVQATLTGTVAFLRRSRAGGALPGEELTADSPTGDGALLAARLQESRTVTISLQHKETGAGDLDWQTSTTRRIQAVALDQASLRATWTGSLLLPAEPGTEVGDAAGVPPVATPGGSTQWRMLVEEHELLDADDPRTQDQNAEPIRLPRLVYADTIAL
ncbi:hypothetical protein GCM10023258_02130 [Terrabacter aeriphilus]|uniref:Uncharacterized protein n=1 Tax=Terrabacter aeriphilus TaxID=515662 RepID=A0ABP9J378_9MICO